MWSGSLVQPIPRTPAALSADWTGRHPLRVIFAVSVLEVSFIVVTMLDWPVLLMKPPRMLKAYELPVLHDRQAAGFAGPPCLGHGYLDSQALCRHDLGGHILHALPVRAGGQPDSHRPLSRSAQPLVWPQHL